MAASVRKAAPRQPGSASSTAAQLVWIALPGPDIDEASSTLLRRGAGGVVLFSRNITGADQLRELVKDLRRRASGPLRVAIDHEGGHIVRLGAPLTRFPGAMAVSATGSQELAYAVARAAGSELASLGIDVNLAPVLDVAHDLRNASVGVRSFGSSPELVAQFGAATIRGYRDAGVAATAKHFPGHGRTPVDPHASMPVVTGGLAALRRHDLPPFGAAIDAGVELVMATHVAYEGLTGGLPSTLAAAVLHDLLRDEMDFAGLTVSDAMNMGALTEGHTIPTACVRSLAAGVDVVMPLEQQSETVTALEQAMASGELPAARVAQALERSERLDDRLSTATARRKPVAPPHAEHLELARTVARRSLTLVHGDDLLPLRPSTSVAVIEFASRRPSPIEEQLSPTPSLGTALKRHLPRVREVIVDGQAQGPATERNRQEAAATEAAADAEFVILATRDAYLWPEEQRLIGRIASTDVRTMLVALRNPYDLARLPRTGAAAAAYADVPVTLEALADALTGRADWPGSLPVELPG